MPPTMSLPIRARPMMPGFEQPTIFNYQLNHADFKVPADIRIPPEIRQAIFDLEYQALDVITTMRVLMQHYNDRYQILCPKNSARFQQHVSSIERLMVWKEQWHPNDPTLVDSAKIPFEGMDIYADEASYNHFAWQHEHMVKAFLCGQLYCWGQTRSAILHRAHELMCNPRSLRFNNVGEHNAFRAWFEGDFTSAMTNWECFCGDLSLPTFGEILLDLRGKIMTRVENGERLARSLSSTPESEPEWEPEWDL